MISRQGAYGRRWGVAAVLALAAFVQGGVALGADLVPYGHVGLRQEVLVAWDDVGGKTDADLLQSRPEVAFGLGVRALALDDTLEANLRVSSAPTDAPTDRWLAAAESGTSRAVGVDRAYLGGTLSAMPELSLTVGLAPVPWRQTGMLWDEDLSLPLAMVRYERIGVGSARFARSHASIAGLLLRSGSPSKDDDQAMLAGATGMTVRLSRTWSLQTDVGYYGLWGERRLGRAIARGEVRVGQQHPGFTTNTTDTDATTPRLEPTQRLIVDGLGSRFHVLSGYAAVRWSGSELLPASVFGHVAWNAGARGVGEEQALGVVLGASVGDASVPGQMALTARWMRIEADAALALLADDALLTNVTGAGLEVVFGAFEGLNLGFDALYTLQVDPELRGLGDDRGELGSEDPAALRLRVFSTWTF